MATSTNFSLPNFPPFDVHIDGNVGPRWRKWLTRFERLLIATNITEAKQQRALLLHYAGPAVDEIFDTLPNTGQDTDYKAAVVALNAYFIPQANSTFEYNFRQAKQQHGENIDAFHTRLRQLDQTCEFANIDNEDNPSLKDLLTNARAQERSEAQATAVEKGPSQINAVRNEHRDVTKSNKTVRRQQQQQQPRFKHPNNTENHKTHRSSTQQCRNCGGIFPHIGECPAKRKECRACGKCGHFSKVCRSKFKRHKIHQVAHLPTDEEPHYIFTVQNNHEHSTSPFCQVHISNEPVQTIIDSGASVNIIDESTYEKIRQHNQHTVLTTPQSKIYTYGSNRELPLLGMTNENVRFRSTTVNATFYVTKGRHGNLLSCNTAQSLGILKLTVNTALNTVSNTQPEKNFPDLFNGIGKIKEKKVKQHIDPEIQPKQQSHCRIHFTFERMLKTNFNA